MDKLIDGSAWTQLSALYYQILHNILSVYFIVFLSLKWEMDSIFFIDLPSIAFHDPREYANQLQSLYELVGSNQCHSILEYFFILIELTCARGST